MVLRRPERVAKLIREEISQILIREMRDPRVGTLEITQVRVTPDLREARVFFRMVGGESERAAVESALAGARGFFQGQLGRRLGLRVTPDLSFKYDDSLDEASRIEALLEGSKLG
jgi:ribosome-binding factor A